MLALALLAGAEAVDWLRSSNPPPGYTPFVFSPPSVPYPAKHVWPKTKPRDWQTLNLPEIEKCYGNWPPQFSWPAAQDRFNVTEPHPYGYRDYSYYRRVHPFIIAGLVHGSGFLSPAYYEHCYDYSRRNTTVYPYESYYKR